VLLVDAFNVVRAQWCLPASRRGLDVRGLIDLIGRSRFAGRRLRVVVDGRPGPEWVRHGVAETLSGLTWTRLGRAEVVFSGPVMEADDVIEDILRRARGLDITVVSSDRRLIAAAARAGADQIGNGSFLRLLDQDRTRAARAGRAATGDRAGFAAEVPLDRYSIAHWMQEFGFEPATADPAPAPPEPSPKPAPKPSPGPPPPPAATPELTPPVAPVFGSRLTVPPPAERPPPAARAPAAEQAAEQTAEHPEPLDPLLRDAFQEWYGALHLEDLDMSRWIDGVEPL
jgi:hypothetical protein